MGNILEAFDSSSVEEISALIDKLEKSSFDYLKLESGGFSIIIGKNGAGEGANAATTHAAGAISTPSDGRPAAAPLDEGAAAAPSAGQAEEISAAPAPAAAADGVSESSAAGSAPAAAIVEQEGILIVKSPNYGIFYAQAEPGAQPYTAIGALVKKGDTLGLLETMKTFTAISSPADGEVIAIHVVNEETLEPGQPLASIRL